jgi:hypothetical protein
MMKTLKKTLKKLMPMMTMRTRIKMKKKTLMKNTIELRRRNSKIYYKMKENRPIPTNIEKMKDKAKMKPREKKKSQKTTKTQLYPNKKRIRKEVNSEDQQERVDQCRDLSRT